MKKSDESDIAIREPSFQNEEKVPKFRLKTSIIQKLLLFSLIILLGVGFTGYTVYKSNQKLFDSQQVIQHTEQVISLSNQILSFGIDIETATRGFIINKDSSFLEPLYKAQKAVFADIEQLRQLTHDNPLQQPRIDSLNFYMLRRLDFSLQTIALRSKKEMRQANTYTPAKEGKGYTDQLRQITDSIQKEERTLLGQRRQTNKYSVTAFNRFLAIMFILMVVSAVLLLITIYKYLLQNKEKERHAANLIIANKELVFQNIEKEKRAEELMIANQDLKTSEQQLKAVNEELESFSYSVSHDLRAPIRAMNGYARMLQDNYGTKFDAEAHRLTNNIINNAKKMGQLIDDLLTFSQIGRKDMLKMNIQMHDMVTSICKELKDDQCDRNIEFTIGSLLPAQADNSALKQVWLNLISNAVKYTRLKDRTVIEIGCKICDEETVYYIKDNGAGFDMRYANKLFEIFQRLHSDDEFEGTGIGLAIVQRIVFKHGGRIWAEGKVNEGAIFYFTLNKS